LKNPIVHILFIAQEGEKTVSTSTEPTVSTSGSATTTAAGAAPLVIAGRTFRSRLFLGTARYPNQQVMLDALEASGAEVATVAIRPEFEALARRLESLIDSYSHNADAAHNAYAYAMQCEYDFFQMAWEAGAQEGGTQ
jgi:hypothetical protein